MTGAPLKLPALPRLSIDRLRDQLVYDGDAGTLTWRRTHGRVRAGDPVAPMIEGDRRSIKFDGKRYAVKTIIFAIVEGRFPTGHLVFADRDPTNIRWSNLLHLETRFKPNT